MTHLEQFRYDIETEIMLIDYRLRNKINAKEIELFYHEGETAKDSARLYVDFVLINN